MSLPVAASVELLPEEDPPGAEADTPSTSAPGWVVPVLSPPSVGAALVVVDGLGDATVVGVEVVLELGAEVVVDVVVDVGAEAGVEVVELDCDAQSIAGTPAATVRGPSGNATAARAGVPCAVANVLAALLVPGKVNAPRDAAG